MTEYYLLLIPLGALIFFAIKILSDFNSMHKSINIRVCDDAEGADVLKIDAARFQPTLERVKESNNSMLAVKGMAIKVSGLVNMVSSELGRPLKESDMLKCSKYFSMYCNAVVHEDLICTSDAPYKEAIAMRYYDQAINDGTFNTKKSITPREFLESCRLICHADLSISSIRRYSRIGRTKICVLNDSERNALTCSENIHCKGNAMLLFLGLNNILEVVDC